MAAFGIVIERRFLALRRAISGLVIAPERLATAFASDVHSVRYLSNRPRNDLNNERVRAAEVERLVSKQRYWRVV